MSSSVPESTSRAEPRVSGQLVSTNQLAQRWQCSATTVRRLTRHARMTRVLLGEGANGTVRYILSEVEAYEDARSTKS